MQLCLLIAEDKRGLQKLVDVFDTVQKKKLKVNINKNKVIVFERSKSEVVDFDDQLELNVKLG